MGKYDNITREMAESQAPVGTRVLLESSGQKGTVESIGRRNFAITMDTELTAEGAPMIRYPSFPTFWENWTVLTDAPAKQVTRFKTITVNDVDGSVAVGQVGETLKEMPLEDLIMHIKHMHDEYGDGYHDGTDFAIDYTIEKLRKMGFLQQLPENWLELIR